MTIKEVEAELQISTPAANALINRMAECGILKEYTGQQRNRVFGYQEYIHLFAGIGEE